MPNLRMCEAAGLTPCTVLSCKGKGITFRKYVFEKLETYAIYVGYTKSWVEILSLIPSACSKEYLYLAGT